MPRPPFGSEAQPDRDTEHQLRRDRTPRRIADLLAEWPPLVVAITVYGSTPAVYERVTEIPDSYRRCIQGIELLLDRKVRLRLKTVPMTLNYTDMGQMRALAAGYGLDFEWDPLVNCRIDGDSKPTAVRLRPDQIVALERAEPILAIPPGGAPRGCLRRALRDGPPPG